MKRFGASASNRGLVGRELAGEPFQEFASLRRITSSSGVRFASSAKFPISTMAPG